MISNHIPVENSEHYDKVVSKLREFFKTKGYIECSVQDRLSILAACEDPETVTTYEYLGQTWPLPQTGQMWLEYELLTRPDVRGVFCLSTSYRQEPDPIPGRHEHIFPMFEFEGRGTMLDLSNLEDELTEFLGFDQTVTKTYEELSQHYNTEDLTAQEENRMQQDFGDVVQLQHFPEHSAPFWNMKRDEDGIAKKIDVIVCGNETIGSAERSSDVEQMRTSFYTTNNGKYATKLFGLFGKERVEQELEEFLSLNFIPRFGGGIGVTRLMHAMNEKELLG